MLGGFQTEHSGDDAGENSSCVPVSTSCIKTKLSASLSFRFFIYKVKTIVTSPIDYTANHEVSTFLGIILAHQNHLPSNESYTNIAMSFTAVSSLSSKICAYCVILRL